MLKFIAIFRNYYGKVSYALSALIILFMTGLSFFQIFYRYLFGTVLIWSNDVNIFCISTAVALTIPPLWLEHSDVVMDLITAKLSPRADFILSCFVETGSLFMAGILTRSGLMAIKMHKGFSTSILRFDDSLRYYFVVYLGAGLILAIILSFIERILVYRQGGNK